MAGKTVRGFIEKPKGDGGWINGGFFVLEPEIFQYIPNDETPFERYPLETLAKNQELMAYKHTGFWQMMDTIRDVQLLQDLWNTGHPPWSYKKQHPASL